MTPGTGPGQNPKFRHSGAGCCRAVRTAFIVSVIDTSSEARSVVRPASDVSHRLVVHSV